jgi:UDP-N-acetylglucosamine:LPS N-acetylglucosamine transferase
VRAAEAIAAAIDASESTVRVQTLDFWSLMNPGVAAIVQEKYLELVLDNPELYARLHRLDERTWRRVIENDIPPPAEVIELIELVTSRTGDGRLSASSLFEWALGPYASDLLLYPTACAAMPTNSRDRAGANVALLRLALLKWAFVRLQSRMEQRLSMFRPDVVVATQMVPAALVSACKASSRRWWQLPLIGVLTDFGAHDYWAQAGVDLYCMPHESITGPPLTGHRRNAVARIQVTGVPLMPPFAAPLGQVEARRLLNLPLDRPLVLVLGGGLGIGLEELVKPLLAELPEPVSLVVMTGRNEAVRERMHGLAAAARGRVRVERWTDHMERFVAASDVVVGKPGGLTVAEVLACGRPLFVTRSLRGQESFNVRFLEREAIGRFLSPGDMVSSIAELLASPVELSAIQKRAWSAGRRDGAARVAAAALEMARPSVGPIHPAVREELNGYR